MIKKKRGGQLGHKPSNTKPNSGSFKKGCISKNKGKHIWKDKIHPRLGKKHTEAAKEKQRIGGIKGILTQSKTKISKAELVLKKYFIKNNINFIHQWKYKYGIADFFLPDFNMIIECDGIYWHSKPDYIKRDKRKRDYLKRKGYLIFVHGSEKVLKMEDSFK